ncbi:MAG TPA: hypothetical protein DD471_01925, partial [Planctomycetes bacterium]|nr:hypothetical protein [Planctomycetota bacterium]
CGLGFRGRLSPEQQAVGYSPTGVTRKLLRGKPLDRSFLFAGVLFRKTSRGAIIKTLSKAVDE